MRFFVFVLVFLSFDWSYADDPIDGSNAQPVVPNGATVRLVPQKKRWFLGENILLHYEVRNEGVQPFSVDSGGDSRGGTRAGRFSVFATHQNGVEQPDPNPYQMNRGGLRPIVQLEPGESWFGNIPLTRYRRLMKPGTYTVRVGHDLGWKERRFSHSSFAHKKDDDLVWAETSIDVVMPTREEARDVLTAMQATPTRYGHWGQPRMPFADFGCLSYPVYLPLLVEISKTHHPEAIPGIGNMFTPEATLALIDLLSLPDDPATYLANRNHVVKKLLYADQSIADASAREVKRRVPYNESFRQVFGSAKLARDTRQKRVAASWRPEHVIPVRAYATDVLLHSQPQGLRDNRKQNAAQLLQAIGTTEDGPAIVAALDNVLQLSQTVRLESPLSYGLIPYLQGCASTLRIRTPTDPKSPGEIAVYLQSLSNSDGHRPALFHRRGPNWLRHPIPFVRRLTLEALPSSIPDWAINELTELAASNDVGLRLQASKRIGDSADSQFRDTLISQIAVESDRWVMDELDRAAYSVGVPRDQILGAWAKRLNKPLYDSAKQRYEPGHIAFRIIRDNVVQFRGGSGANGNTYRHDPKLSDRWVSFIRANRADLLSGRKYNIGDPELTEDLFPTGSHIYHNGKRWPAKNH